MKEKIGLTGRVELVIQREDGSVEREEFDNLVVTTGKNWAAGRLGNTGPAAISHIAIGTGATAPEAGDTALQTELDRNTCTTSVTNNTVTYASTWAPGDGTGALTEAGLFNAGAGGTMISRVTFAVKNKGAGDAFSINWTLTQN